MIKTWPLVIRRKRNPLTCTQTLCWYQCSLDPNQQTWWNFMNSNAVRSYYLSIVRSGSRSLLGCLWIRQFNADRLFSSYQSLCGISELIKLQKPALKNRKWDQLRWIHVRYLTMLLSWIRSSCLSITAHLAGYNFGPGTDMDEKKWR